MIFLLLETEFQFFAFSGDREEKNTKFTENFIEAER